MPARGVVTGRQGRRILLSLVMGGGPGSCSLAVRYPGNYESRATPRAPARQGKETGSPCWYPRDVTGRQGKRILPARVMRGGLGACRCPRVTQSRQRSRLSHEILIKCLMDRVSESELVVGLSALPPRGIMGMGPSASYVLYRKLFRCHNLCGLIAGIGCYGLALVMGRRLCFAGQTRNVLEYKG